MVKIMDIPNSKGRNSFWEAYRACAEENSVRPDRSQFYVNWAKDFANFLLIQALRGAYPRCSWNRTLSKKYRGVKIIKYLRLEPSRHWL
jgi:hypothetical protein